MSKGIFIVLQQGGSSCEWYVQSHETIYEAEDAIRSIKAHTYDATDPIEVGPTLTELLLRPENNKAHGELYELLDSVVDVVAMRQFSELSPDACDDCVGMVDPGDSTCQRCGTLVPE